METCPKCNMRVILKSNGTCPSCQYKISQVASMEITVICPHCKKENYGSKLNCERCQTSLIGIPRLVSPFADIDRRLPRKNKVEEFAKIESKSLVAGRLIGSVFIAEVLLFFVTREICSLLNQLNWNDFFSTLFIVGFLTIILGIFLGKSIDLVPSSFPLAGNNNEGKILRGSPIFLVATTASGVLAMVLSILIPLIFTK